MSYDCRLVGDAEEITVGNLSNFDINNVDFSMADLRLVTELDFLQLQATGEYNATGHVMELNVSGNGSF